MSRRCVPEGRAGRAVQGSPNDYCGATARSEAMEPGLLLVALIGATSLREEGSNALTSVYEDRPIRSRKIYRPHAAPSDGVCFTWKRGDLVCWGLHD